MASSLLPFLALLACRSCLAGESMVHRQKREFSFSQPAACVQTKGFYRNPQRPRATPQDLLTDCRSFYRCVSGTVFKLSCPPGTYFNMINQNCEGDGAMTADNCALDTKEDYKPATTPHPIFNSTTCGAANFACANGACVAKELFCNNANDCTDGSDETLCSLEDDPLRSDVCNKDACQLPDCFCSSNGQRIPGDLPVDQVPQMVLLQFDDSINDNNIPIYDAIFTPNRTNPVTGCPIKGTFFVTHTYNNYQYLEKLSKAGNEIALKDVDNDRSESYWMKATEDKLQHDMVTERRIISKFGRIPEETMTGMRVPFLKGAGNAQFSMMQKNGIKWDSTISVEPLDIPVWPYTLNYRIPHKCYPPEKQAQCPARSFPGLWELPLNSLKSIFDDPCTVLGACGQAETAEDMVAMLDTNLNHFYTTNRAPYVLSMSTNWFVPQHLDGLQQWIDKTLANRHDVFFVTSSQAIQWIQTPTPTSNIKGFAPWQCPANSQPPVCEEPHGCNLDGATPEMRSGYMITCLPCPSFYPDFGIPDGEVLDA